MKRFLIFAALFPLLAMLVFISPLMAESPGLPSADVIIVLFVSAYTLAIIPALLSAATDWALRRTVWYVRISVTMAAAALFAWLAARYLGASEPLVLLMGAIPAAVCSWLSNERP